MQIDLIPALADNYIFALFEPQEDWTCIIDPAEAAPVLRYLTEKKRVLTHILNTHHHPDHTAGNRELKEKTRCQIWAPALEIKQIDGVDRKLTPDESLQFGKVEGLTLEAAAHTRGHLAFHFPSEKVLFTGDAIFSLGCGRLFEGSYGQMWNVIQKIRELPDETQIYCGHEYTLKNVRFAQTLEPFNAQLKRFSEEVARLRKDFKPTLPSTIGREKVLNPFFKCDDPQFAASIQKPDLSPLEIFTYLRKKRDDF